MLTGFQLKSAKVALGYTALHISEAIGIHQSTITRLCLTENHKYLACSVRTMALLEKFFEHENVEFLDRNSIAWKGRKVQTNKITRFQLRTARIAADITQEELSFHLKISSSTLSLLEQLDNEECVKMSELNLIALRKYFEIIGVTFPDSLTVKLARAP